MNTFTAVMLFVTIVTGDGKPDIKHRQAMPDMETCVMELGKFLRHQFPDAIGAQSLNGGCSGKLVEENPS